MKLQNKHIIATHICVLSHFVIFIVSKPAPHFEGTAVVNGEFTQLSLTDYAGKYVVFFFYPLDLYVFAIQFVFIHVFTELFFIFFSAHSFAQQKSWHSPIASRNLRKSTLK